MHQREKIRHTPMFGDLAVMHSHDIHGFKVDSSAGRLNTQECSLLRSMLRLVSRHHLTVGCLPMDLFVEIRECCAKCAVKAPDAFFIRRGVWLWGMVNKVVSEEILEYIEVPTALHFFGIAADNSLRGIC
jgi:hypothetical protein